MIPSPAEIRQIFNDTYNIFYKKWINPDTPFDPEAMLQEARELTQKYDYSLCRTITAELIVCIEEERGRNNEAN